MGKNGKKATKPKCEVTGCENKGKRQKCCDKVLCTSCVFNMVSYCQCIEEFQYKCPFCRKGFSMPENILKRMMADHCPSHAKVMDGCHEKKYVVAHSPCDAGCYGCDKSTLRVLH